ncbi:MAG: hypothetical protein ACI857_002620, partial [Arenicella sp.]
TLEWEDYDLCNSNNDRLSLHLLRGETSTYNRRQQFHRNWVETERQMQLYVVCYR